MSNGFAPQYSTAERVRLVLILAAIAIPVYLLSELWFFDWLSDYAAIANCHVYGNLTGVHLLFYGMFVGIPASLALLVLSFEGRRSLRVLRLGQNPLPGEKTLRKTRYKYGAAARLQPIGLIAAILFLLGLSIWGAGQARQLTATIAPCDGIEIIHWR